MKYDYYEFPGGGIEKDESMIDCLIRETKEEAGLIIKPESIKEFGYVHRIHKDKYDNELTFVQDNYYYLCDVEDIMISQSLSEKEKDERFVLELVDINTVINVNRNNNHGPENLIIIDRDTKVLEMAVEYLKKLILFAQLPDWLTLSSVYYRAMALDNCCNITSLICAFITK